MLPDEAEWLLSATRSDNVEVKLESPELQSQQQAQLSADPNYHICDHSYDDFQEALFPGVEEFTDIIPVLGLSSSFGSMFPKIAEGNFGAVFEIKRRLPGLKRTRGLVLKIFKYIEPSIMGQYAQLDVNKYDGLKRIMKGQFWVNSQMTYIVMPKIGTRGFEDRDKTLANFQKLADDLKWIYDHSFCYADVREENIRVDDDGTCHFVDFDNLVSSIFKRHPIQRNNKYYTTVKTGSLLEDDLFVLRAIFGISPASTVAAVSASDALAQPSGQEQLCAPVT